MFTILNAFNTSRELNTYKHNLEWSLQFISGLASINKQKRRYCIEATLAHACSGIENGENKVDTTNRCEALKYHIFFKYVKY